MRFIELFVLGRHCFPHHISVLSIFVTSVVVSERRRSVSPHPFAQQPLIEEEIEEYWNPKNVVFLEDSQNIPIGTVLKVRFILLTDLFTIFRLLFVHSFDAHLNDSPKCRQFFPVSMTFCSFAAQVGNCFVNLLAMFVFIFVEFIVDRHPFIFSASYYGGPNFRIICLIE